MAALLVTAGLSDVSMSLDWVVVAAGGSQDKYLIDSSVKGSSMSEQSMSGQLSGASIRWTCCRKS